MAKTCRKWVKIGALERELHLAGKLLERGKEMATHSLNADRPTGYSDCAKPYIAFE